MAKSKYSKVTIIGMGLMGGSLGRALLKKKLAKNVTGLGRNMSRLKVAKKKGAATHVTLDIEEGVKGADIVVISLPVMLIPSMFVQIQPFLDKKTIVTDMGSVKASIVETIKLFDRNRCFVGSHPMVGSEKTGIYNIKERLYEGGVCIVAGGNKKKASKIAAFWKKAGMKVIPMAPSKHDKLISGVSHFPHLLSFMLINTQAGTINKNRSAIGPGFMDATRIAASGEDIWAEIMIANKKEVINNIKTAREELLKIKKMIAFNKMKGIKEYIRKARILRESLEK